MPHSLSGILDIEVVVVPFLDGDRMAGLVRESRDREQVVARRTSALRVIRVLSRAMKHS